MDYGDEPSIINALRYNTYVCGLGLCDGCTYNMDLNTSSAIKLTRVSGGRARRTH